METPVEQSEPAAITPVKVVLPTGLHDQIMLSALAASGGKISGVVFAVGITDYKRVQETQSPQELESLLSSVREMIASLLGPQDFAARSSVDSFILIFNNESGAAAQRRINQVSERLWDFQLRSLGVSSILFSWGAVEVQDEPFESAVAGATERLEQSRRNRKTASVTPAPRAVNG
jgi:GGDEF domain-containing protein